MGHERARARGLVAGMLGADLVEHLSEALQASVEVLRRDARDALLDERGVQAVHDVVDEVALLHVSETRVERLGADARGHEPAQGAGDVALDLRSGELARHQAAGVALVTLVEDQVPDGVGAELLRRQACDPLAGQARPAGGIEVPHDVALAHRDGARRRPAAWAAAKLRPHRRRVAVPRLAVMRHAGENRPGTRGGERAVEEVPLGCGGLELDGREAELRPERRERALLVREREAVDVGVCYEDGVDGACGQQRGVGERHEAHAGHLRVPVRTGVREVGRLGATTGGDRQAVQHRGRHGLADIELARGVDQGLDGLRRHRGLDACAHRAVPPAEGGRGQRRRDRAHGLQRRDRAVLPEAGDDAAAHRGDGRIGLRLVGAAARGLGLGLVALEHAKDCLGRDGSVGADLLVELARRVGVHAGQRRVQPIGKLRGGPPRRCALGVVARLLHARDHVGQRGELAPDRGVAEARDDGALRADAAGGEARRDLIEDLGGARGGHDHVAPLACEPRDRVGIGCAAGMRARDLEELGVGEGGRARRGGRARLEGARVRAQLGGQRALVGIEQPGDLARVGDGAQQPRHMAGHPADVAHGDEARAGRGLRRDEARQEAGRLGRLDAAARAKHLGVARHQRENDPLGIALGLSRIRGGRRRDDGGQQGLRDLRDEADRAGVAAQRGERGVAAARHQGGDEHAALERPDDAAPVAEELPKPLDPRRRRRDVDGRADAGVRHRTPAEIALGARRHQKRRAPMLPRPRRDQRDLGCREPQAGLS